MPSDYSPPTKEARAVARLLDALVVEGGVALDEIATLSHLGDATLLQACRECRQHLTPLDRMRLAAAAAMLSPGHARLAHNVYSQAQAELRFLAREIRSVRPASESEADRSSAAARRTNAGDATPKAAELVDRAAAAQARARVLLEAQERLLETARSLVTDGRVLRSANVDALKAEVLRFARTARIIEEQPERAVVAMKSALRLALTVDDEQRGEILSQAVTWFAEEYYAA